MKSYTIHLIRHGVCEGNLEGRYIGRTQSPLAQEGIQALLEQKRTWKIIGAKMQKLKQGREANTAT